VKIPVPGPSSITGPFPGAISCVISRANVWLEGAIAETCPGLATKARMNSKKSKASEAFIEIFLSSAGDGICQETAY
jgi:hypothetical protein